MIIQVITNGTVTNTVHVADGAVVTSGVATWTGDSFPAPAGSTLMSQPGAGIGWTLSGGVLISPAIVSPALTIPQLTAIVWQAQGSVLEAGITTDVNPAAPINVLCDGTPSTQASLALLALYGQINPAGTKLWIDNKGVATTLTGAQCVALATNVGNWIENTYITANAAIAQIAAGTITTSAQVSALIWPAA